MTQGKGSIWPAVIAAEDEYGEGAEEYARREARIAAAAGMANEARRWLAVADELHTLHSINQRWARPARETRPVSAFANRAPKAV
ncbi:hypothetical protein [Sphingopyxis sp.]|uniref:hypothetical protein n=1 Tax=Sphingopyxis sp. TaxID=1908224 RepID=UPI002D79CD8E|nr:hypothetical protein [Sphingopyxis sp.]HET6523166.1 hypothetical protein [Sphingopyxis sp.]